VFCLAIAFPVASAFLRIKPEGRLAEAANTPFPAFAWDALSAKATVKALTDGWLDRNFPFRQTLIRWHNYWSASVFGKLSPNSPVLAGKDSWLFLAIDHDDINVLEESRTALTQTQLERLVRVFTERQAWLAGQGIKYLIVVPPNKDSIYPEFLPDSYSKAGGVSRLDQVMEYIAHHTTLDVLDLRPALLAAKKKTRIFCMTDSHWNADGAFAAYQAIISRLVGDFPQLKPMDASSFFQEEYPFPGGDLSFILGLRDVLTENVRVFIPKTPFAARGMSTGIDRPDDFFLPVEASVLEDKSLPKAVFFRDSYFVDILPFLGEHFSRMVSVWVKFDYKDGRSIFDKELVSAEKPDVVVEEIAERFFLHVPASAK